MSAHGICHWALVALVASIFAPFAGAVGSGLTSDGWTIIEPASGTLKIYVSSSEGNDANSGIVPWAPVRTLSKGLSLISDGFSDQLLLKRGDVWTNQNFGFVQKSGSSPTQPLLISYYGDMELPRPLIRTGMGDGFGQRINDGANIALVGLHFQAHTYTGTEGPTGVIVLGPMHDLLIEDCLIEGYASGIVAQAFTGALANITVRRTVVRDCYSISSHSQGMFADGVSGLTVEECVFDHNGWKQGLAGAEADVFSHNVYILHNNSNVVFRNNLFARASSHGIQARSGGIVEGNLFVRNPIAVLLGGGDVAAVGGITGTVANNVIIQGNDINGSERAWGIEVSNVNPLSGATVLNNLIAGEASGGTGKGIILNGKVGPAGFLGVNNVTVEDNIVYDWGQPFRVVGGIITGNRVANNVFEVTNAQSTVLEYFFTTYLTPLNIEYEGNSYFSNTPTDKWFTLVEDIASIISISTLNVNQWAARSGESGAQSQSSLFNEPTRDLATYNGLKGGPATLDACLAAIEGQRRGAWNPDYEIAAVRDYIRGGFNAVGLTISGIVGEGVMEVGKTHDFAVLAESPSPIQYQWLKDGVEIPGATQDHWQIGSLKLGDSGLYTVIVTDEMQEAVAGPVALKVVADIPSAGGTALVIEGIALAVLFFLMRRRRAA